MKKTALVVLACALLAGCESEEAKLERLQQEAALSRGLAEAREADLEKLEGVEHAPGLTLPRDTIGLAAYRDSLQTLARAARTRATLAQRDLDRFLR